MKEFDHYDDFRKFRTKTTVSDDGRVVSVLIVFDEPVPIIEFSLEKRIGMGYSPVLFPKQSTPAFLQPSNVKIEDHGEN